MPQLTQSVQNEILLIARGVLGAIIAGALFGILHYFGVPLPPSIVLPTMALGGYGALKVG